MRSVRSAWRASAALAVLLAVGASAVPARAAAPLAGAGASPACHSDVPRLRHLVLFEPGTGRDAAAAEIDAACGTLAGFYPEIAVAVATSTDHEFDNHIGRYRAYGAQGEGVAPQPRRPVPPRPRGIGVQAVPAESPTPPARLRGAGDRTGEQWDMTMIGADRAHAVRRGSAGVLVGVLDSGVDGDHPELSAALDRSASASCVTGLPEPGLQALHPADEHGTHVAGIIAANGNAGGFLGVSPAVTLRAYRVFGKGAEGASSFAIAKAIDRAVADGCDLLNLSLGGGPDDPTTSEAIKAARAKGVVCVIASGNEGGPVAWPARHPLAVSISALGFKGAWPAGAMQVQTVTEPTGKEQSFIADFSNTGPEIDLAGPGVGVISCIPHDRFGVMDGTSMACPAVTGALARRLAADTATLGMPRDADRADAIVRLALAVARDMGLPPLAQGAGLAQ